MLTTIWRNTMNTETKRATIYLDPVLHKALRIKAAETSRSMSEIVNEAVKQALTEDAEDLAAFEERANEPLVSFENMLKELKKDGRI
jgi:plasmid stability protein